MSKGRESVRPEHAPMRSQFTMYCENGLLRMVSSRLFLRSYLFF